MRFISLTFLFSFNFSFLKKRFRTIHLTRLNKQWNTFIERSETIIDDFFVIAFYGLDFAFDVFQFRKQ